MLEFSCIEMLYFKAGWCKMLENSLSHSLELIIQVSVMVGLKFGLDFFFFCSFSIVFIKACPYASGTFITVFTG